MNNLKKIKLSTRNPVRIALPVNEEAGAISLDLTAFDKWVVSQLPKSIKTKLAPIVDTTSWPEVKITIATVKSEQPIVEWYSNGVTIQVKDHDTGEVFDFLTINAPKGLPRYLRSRIKRAMKDYGV